jgi:hypothetical protein
MSKTLIIYSYYRDNENTDYFFKNGLCNSDLIDYLFVINDGDIGGKISPPQEILDSYSNISVVHRDNQGMDWGAYTDVLQSKKSDGSLNDYDYFIFLNQTIIGPFLPAWLSKDKHWPTIFTDLINERDKLVGCTINCCYMTPNTYMPHVQSFLFATDQVGLEVGFKEGMFDPLEVRSKFDVIYEREIGFSRAILHNNYNISCLMSCYKGVDFREGEPKIKGNDPWVDGGYFSCNIHPFETIFFKNNRRLQPKLIENLKSWSNL